MAKNKTVETKLSVDAYANKIADPARKKDFKSLIKLFEDSTGLAPKMWGTAIVGFGSYHYKYDSGHEGDAPLVGLSSRANAIVLYLSANFKEREELLQKLGKHKTGKACIYVQKLADIDSKVLSKMIRLSFNHTKANHS